MKKHLLNIIFTILIQAIGFGQEYMKSKEFELTKFEYSDFMKVESENEKFDGYMSIFLKNKNGENIKEIKVYGETYENDAIVYELENVKFSNIRKILKVEISECACYCNTSIYFWLITKQNEWISLPIVEQGSYEIEMKYYDYVFLEKGQNVIQLMEYQDERIDKKIFTPENIRRKSEKVIRTIFWNGKKLNEK